MQQCWARLLSKKQNKTKKTTPRRLRCSAVGWGLPGLCRLAYIWREAWRNLSDVQSSVCRFEPTHSSPSFCRPGSLTERKKKKKLTKYVMSWAVKKDSGVQTHTHRHKYFRGTQTFFSCKKKKKRRQPCSLGIIRAHAEPGRQSLASWEQGPTDEASLFKSLGRDECVLSVESLQETCTGLEEKKQPRRWKEDGKTDGDRKKKKNCRWTERQEGVFEEMKGERIRAKIQSDIPSYC